MKGMEPGALVSIGRILLTATFAMSLIGAMRGKHDLSIPFERLVIGILALMLFQSVGLELQGLSTELTAAISSFSGQEDLKAVVLEAFKKSAASGGSSLNVPAVLEQAWRVGVWGVMTSLVDGVFLVVSFVLECAQQVLWALLLFLFPLAAGAFPVFPKMLTNLALYALELSLWFPVLCLVELITGRVARTHLAEVGSWGLYIVGIEVVAIVLILLIPTVTHRFLSGAFSGDFGSQSEVFVLVKKAVQIGKSFTGGLS